MSDIRQQIKFSHVLKYTIGMISISFGVVFMLRSDIGNSSWDTLHYSLDALLHDTLGISWFTIGWAMILVATIFTILVIILTKNYKYLFMFVPILLVGRFVDVVNLYIMVDFLPSTIFLRIVSYVLGVILLPLGGALLLSSTYPAGVFDEFMFAVARKLKTEKIVIIRVIMELTAVLVALTTGFIAGIGFGKIGIGTLIFSLLVGTILKYILMILEKLGLYKDKQNY